MKMEGDYQFDDVDISAEPQKTGDDHGHDDAATANTGVGAGSTTSNTGQDGGGRYADEIFSKQIRAKFRTFYVDLKESSNGKFVKISEKSHGRKSTIMMDAEDIGPFIEALQEVQGQL